MITKELIETFKDLQGKTITVVYIFEGEDAPGFDHYHVWQSNVISGWLNAIQTIHCLPYILDVRTFVEKAVNHSLPNIDYILNLNCGSKNLSSMGLVPSVCGFLDIPCIPCNTNSIIAGEDKYIANLIASARGVNTPKELPLNDSSGIYRPLNCGSSVGVRRGVSSNPYRDGTYQEFIVGYDITTPLVYSPVTQSIEVMPGILILPDSGNPEWFYGEEENKTGLGFHKQVVQLFSSDLIHKYKDLARAFSISTYCRIDARIKCNDRFQLDKMLQTPLAADDIFFLEINPMPSIRYTNNDFNMSFQNISSESSLGQVINIIDQLWNDKSLYTFLLTCSMISNIRARCKKQKDYNHVC